MIAMDYYPTLLELAGLELPSSVKSSMDGVSLLPLLKGEKEIDREAIFWHYPHYHTQGAKPYSAVRKGDWKLIRQFENDFYELYNLKSDVSENNNVLAEYPEKVEELKTLLYQWYSEVDAQFAVDNPNYDSNKHDQILK